MGLMVINHSNPYIHSTTVLCDNYVPGVQKVIIKTLTMTIPGASLTVVQRNGYPCGTGTTQDGSGTVGNYAKRFFGDVFF